MTFLPLRTRALPSGELLCVSDAGQFAAVTPAFADQLFDDELAKPAAEALASSGLAIDEDDAFAMLAHSHALAERFTTAGTLDYLILVPTLRCNLDCSYCQVSRVGAARHGFDWSEATLEAVLALIDRLPTDRIKIEFQGGEPTLRCDLIARVIDRCTRFADRQFVICSNLQVLTPEVLALLDRPDVYLSTSLDGPSATHAQNRTKEAAATGQFLTNLRTVIDRYGPGKVSALPTINPLAPPAIDDLIDTYQAFGLRSIFLRPINYQGFARKRHSASRTQDRTWHDYHRCFVERLIERNWQDRDQVLEETYLSICLRRIFRPGQHRHVDLRNPNPMGVDYIVVNYDGTAYPTDEARMLARSGTIDLAIGHIAEGWDTEARRQLNAQATNQFDPTCQRCAYQPFCGRDLIDDLARYGRIDLPRTETEFCRRHLAVFDFIFELIYRDDPATRHSLSRWLQLPGTPAALGSRLE